MFDIVSRSEPGATEFLDPGGEEVYFKLPDATLAVEDELYWTSTPGSSDTQTTQHFVERELVARRTRTEK